MIISQWGIFPGWWEQKPEPNGSFRLGSRTRIWKPADFDMWCSVVHAAENWEHAK